MMQGASSPAARGGPERVSTPQTVARGRALSSAAPKKCDYCHQPANGRRILYHVGYRDFEWVCGSDRTYLKKFNKEKVDTESFRPMDISLPRAVKRQKKSGQDHAEEAVGFERTMTNVRLVDEGGRDAVSEEEFEKLATHDTVDKIFYSDPDQRTTKPRVLRKFMKDELKHATCKARRILNQEIDEFQRLCVPQLKKNDDSFCNPYHDDAVVGELPHEASTAISRLCETKQQASVCNEKVIDDAHDFVFPERTSPSEPTQLRTAERDIGTCDVPIRGICLIRGALKHEKVTRSDWREADQHHSKAYRRTFGPLRSNRMDEPDVSDEMSIVFITDFFIALRYARPGEANNAMELSLFFNGYPVLLLVSTRPIKAGEPIVVKPPEDCLWHGNFGATILARSPAGPLEPELNAMVEEPSEVAVPPPSSSARHGQNSWMQDFCNMLTSRRQDLSESGQDWALELAEEVAAALASMKELEPRSVMLIGVSGVGKTFATNCMIELTAHEAQSRAPYGLSYLRRTGRRTEPVALEELEAAGTVGSARVVFCSPAWQDGERREVKEWTDEYGGGHHMERADVEFDQLGGEKLRSAWRQVMHGKMRSYIAPSEALGCATTACNNEYTFGTIFHAAFHFYSDAEMQEQIRRLMQMLPEQRDEYEAALDDMADEPNAVEQFDFLCSLFFFVTTGEVSPSFNVQDCETWPVLEHRGAVQICDRVAQRLGTVVVVAGTGFCEQDDRIYVRKKKEEFEQEFAYVIKVVVNFVPSTLLSKGLKLVDSCGTADLHPLRMERTKRELERATLAIVITEKSLEQDQNTNALLSETGFYKRLLLQDASLAVLSTKDEKALSTTALDIFKHRFEGTTDQAVQQQIGDLETARANVLRQSNAQVNKELHAAYRSLTKQQQQRLPSKERAVARALEERFQNLGVVLLRMYTSMKLGLPACEDAHGDWHEILAMTHGGELFQFLEREGCCSQGLAVRERLLTQANARLTAQRARSGQKLSPKDVSDGVQRALRSKCAEVMRALQDEIKQKHAQPTGETAHAFCDAAFKVLDSRAGQGQKQPILEVSAASVRHYSVDAREQLKGKLGKSLEKRKGRGRQESIKQAFMTRGSIQSCNGKGLYDVLFQHAMAPDRTELERWTASLEEQTRSAVVAWLTEAVQERLCGAGSKYSYISFTKHVQGVVEQDAQLSRGFRELQTWLSQPNLHKAWDEARERSLRDCLLEPLGQLKQADYVKVAQRIIEGDVVDNVIDGLKLALTQQLEDMFLTAVEALKRHFAPSEAARKPALHLLLLKACVKAVAEDLDSQLPPPLPWRGSQGDVPDEDMAEAEAGAGADAESERQEAVLWLEHFVRDLERLEATMHQPEIPPPFLAGCDVEIQFTSGWFKGVLDGGSWESATGVPLFRVAFPDGEKRWTRIPHPELRLPA